MKKDAARPLAALVAASLAASACAEDSPPPDDAVGPVPDLAENAMKVPGFADFMAVDGDAVWVTNDGRVEKWTPAGLVASTPVPRPCGAMTTAAGSLWVANCKDGDVYRINLATAEVEAKIATGLGNPKGETNVVSGAGSVWVPSDPAGKVARIDPALAIGPQQQAPRPPRQRRTAAALAHHRLQIAALFGSQCHPVHALQEGAYTADFNASMD